ncbi:MAG: hypothetical protein AABW67_01760 [Nanoarchaeota archaeon]
METIKINTDLHNHLGTNKYNGDFNQVINISSRQLGPAGILGICNGEDNRYEFFVNLKGYGREDFKSFIYLPSKNLFVVKGQEVFTKQGHVLVLGLEKDKHIKSKDLEDVLKEAKDNKEHNVIIATHPFFFQGCGNYLINNPQLIRAFDAIEVHSGEAIYGNKNAKIFYELIKDHYDIGAVSFSDGHSLYEIGSSQTILDMPSEFEPNKFIASLRNSIKQHKDYSNDKQNFSLKGFLDHSMKMIGRNIIGC